MPDLIRAVVLARDMQCVWCAQVQLGERDSCHHRQLKSRGGPDAPHNRAGLCGGGAGPGCHWRAHVAEPGAATHLGYLVASWADPLEVPMWHEPLGSWVLLSRDGGFTEMAGTWAELARLAPGYEVAVR
jgi:hypothetical protein